LAGTKYVKALILIARGCKEIDGNAAVEFNPHV